MSSIILKRLNQRLYIIENTLNRPNPSWKTLPSLQRQANQNDSDSWTGYHSLRYTIDPLNKNQGSTFNRDFRPADWGGDDPDEFYEKGSPAPVWGPDELQVALYPQFKLEARRIFNTKLNKNFMSKPGRSRSMDLEDLVSNMAIRHQQIISRGEDGGRDLPNGYVGYIIRSCKEAATKGVGGTEELRRTKGILGRVEDKENDKLIHTTNIAVPEHIIDTIGRQYRNAPSHQKDKDNPYAPFSSEVYRLCNDLIQALESNDEEALASVRSQLTKLRVKVDDSLSHAYGTETGMRTIQTSAGIGKQDSEAQKDKLNFYKTKIASISPDPEKDTDLGFNDIEDTIGDSDDFDAEVIQGALEMGRAANLSSPEDVKLEFGQDVSPLEDYDMRYLLRLLAGWLPKDTTDKNGGRKYPYKNTKRDPEIVDGELSKWRLAGMPPILDQDKIKSELGGRNDVRGATSGIDAIINNAPTKLSSQEESAIRLYAAGLGKSDVAKRLTNSSTGKTGVSAVLTGKYLAKAVDKMGLPAASTAEVNMSLEEIRKAYAASNAGQQAAELPKAYADNVHPLTKLIRWVQIYKEEELNESIDRFDRTILENCIKALKKLHYKHVIMPIMM